MFFLSSKRFGPSPSEVREKIGTLKKETERKKKPGKKGEQKASPKAKGGGSCDVKISTLNLSLPRIVNSRTEGWVQKLQSRKDG